MKKLTKATVLRLALVTGLAALSGCQSLQRMSRAGTEANPAPCPNVVVLQDAGRQVNFIDAQTLENVAYTAEITNVDSSCRYFDEEPIRAELEVDFAVGRGPRAGAEVYNMTYFVAVTRTNRDLIAKEEFTIPVRFSGGRTTVNFTDKIDDIVIPRKNKDTSGVNFEIVVGLSLSRDEVLFNRSGKSLKFPELD